MTFVFKHCFVLSNQGVGRYVRSNPYFWVGMSNQEVGAMLGLIRISSSCKSNFFSRESMLGLACTLVATGFVFGFRVF